MLLFAAYFAFDPVGASLLLARLWILAQETPTQIAPWLTALNLGVSGIVLYLFVVDRIAPTGERNQLREELRQRNKDDRELLIPTIVKANETQLRVIEVLHDIDGGRRR